MKKIWLAWVCTALVLSIYIWHFPVGVYAQAQSSSTASKTTPDNQNSVVTVSASVTVQVGNQTLKAKDGMLRSSIINFLSSGPNVLKTPETDQPDVKSKIVNQINNVTQNVQGLEATNAIIGVEVSKALKTLVASSDKPNQNEIVTIQTSSTCKPLTAKAISCENTVTIK